MNAAPPVSQAQPSNDVAQPTGPASAAATSTRAGSQDFAAALSDAGGKPARKSAANKQQGPALSGSALPPPGNQPPPAQSPPPPAQTDVSAAAVAQAAAAQAAAVVKGAADGAQAAKPGANPAGANGAANANGVTTILTTANLVVPPSGASAPAPADSAAPAVGPDAKAAGSDMTMPHAASIRTLAAPGPSTATTVSARAVKSSDAANSATESANSAPASTNANALSGSNLNNGPAGIATDAVAQSVMAAAITQGANTPAPDTSSGVPQGAAAPSDPAAGDPAAGDPAAGDPALGDPATALARTSAAATAATSAAVSAATAASITQAVSEAAVASVADRRSHTNGPDATLAGASNDGSAGAAQLLTSNTSTDRTMPTFKVEAGVDTGQFGQGVADRVSLMMDGNLTNAKLQVNPPALGPIEVRIALQGGHAQVWLSSHSAVTRDALESSSPKLREMLSSQGFSQVSVDISQRSFQERSPQSQAYESGPSISGAARVMTQAAPSVPRNASGLLDAYA